MRIKTTGNKITSPTVPNVRRLPRALSGKMDRKAPSSHTKKSRKILLPTSAAIANRRVHRKRAATAVALAAPLAGRWGRPGSTKTHLQDSIMRCSTRLSLQVSFVERAHFLPRLWATPDCNVTGNDAETGRARVDGRGSREIHRPLWSTAIPNRSAGSKTTQRRVSRWVKYFFQDHVPFFRSLITLPPTR